MKVEFTRRLDNGTLAEFQRPDGVRVRLTSYDRTGLVPHDAAHLIIERAFGLAHGVWGCLSEGAEFATVELLAGRTRHDHQARSAALLKEHSDELRLAERVVGTVLGALEGETRHLARDLAATWSLCSVPPPADLEAAGRSALTDLTDLRTHWNRLRAGDTFTLDWPLPRPNRRPGRWNVAVPKQGTPPRHERRRR